MAEDKKLPDWLTALKISEPKFLAVIENPKIALRELGFAYQIIRNSKELKNCSAGSITDAIVNIARTSITLNPVLGLAYLVPTKGVCYLRFSYKGFIELITDGGKVKYISAHIYYADEEFGEDPVNGILFHKPKQAKDEAAQKARVKAGVYTRAILHDGTVVFNVVPAWEVEKSRACSPIQARADSPWNKWEEDQWKKTGIRKHYHILPKGNNHQTVAAAIEAEDNADMVSKNAKAVKDVSSKLADMFSAYEDVTDQPEANPIITPDPATREPVKQLSEPEVNPLEVFQKQQKEAQPEPVSKFEKAVKETAESNTFEQAVKNAPDSRTPPVKTEVPNIIDEKKKKEKIEKFKVDFESVNDLKSAMKLLINYHITDQEVENATKPFDPRLHKTKKGLIDMELKDGRDFFLSICIEILENRI